MEIIATDDIGGDRSFWGASVEDERFIVVAQRRA
jgi:hypothetical protein